MIKKFKLFEDKNLDRAKENKIFENKTFKNTITIKEFYEILKKDGYDVINYIQIKSLLKSFKNESEIYSYPIVNDYSNCVRLNKKRKKITISYHNIPFDEMQKLRKQYNFKII